MQRFFGPQAILISSTYFLCISVGSNDQSFLLLNEDSKNGNDKKKFFLIHLGRLKPKMDYYDRKGSIWS